MEAAANQAVDQAAARVVRKAAAANPVAAEKVAAAAVVQAAAVAMDSVGTDKGESLRLALLIDYADLFDPAGRLA